MSVPVAGGPVVRALCGAAELDAFFALAAATFPRYHRLHCTPAPDGSVAAGWRRFVEGMPTYRAGHVRGAFEGDRLVGGYLHEERWLHVGGVRLRSGYVGAVVADPSHRGRGVGGALMRAAIDHARQEHQALLFLRGVADYYGRFGYADVMELTEHAVEAAEVLALEAPGCEVRAATPEDAPALLGLHARHYFPYTGSYARTPAQQEHFLRHRSEAPLLAIDGAGIPRGYLFLPGDPDRSGAVEVAADTWPAALALLRRHAAEAGGAAALRWPLPPDAPTYFHLADHLPLRSETRSRPDAGFMARPADLGALFEGLIPLWRERWRRARAAWSGVLVLEVDGRCCCLELGDDLRRLDAVPVGATSVRLTAQALAQLVFGYRPARWLAPSAPEALDALFPAGVAWYPASNRC